MQNHMKTRRYLAWIVTALLLLTSFALPAPQAAAEATSLDYLELPALAAQETPEVKGEQNKGQCGPNLYWSFDPSTGALSITGSGYMYEYGPDAENPWVKNGISAEIKSVSLPKGITEIDAYGFFGCEALTSVELPDTVKVIGEGAFKQCANLRTITLSKKVTTINASAFEGCANLKEVRYQGKQDDRVKIRILAGNEPLLKATWQYANSSSKAIAIKTQPKNLSVKEGATATFKVKVTGATTIQWQYRKPYETTWYDINVTSASLAVRGSYSVNGYYFRCKVSDGYTTLYSSEAQLTVKLVPLTIKTHPKTIKANLGKTVTFKIKATGASNYSWQVKFPNESSWRDLENTNTPNISLKVDRSDYDGLQFRCVVSNDRGDVKYSNPGKLCVKIKITQKPKAVKVSEGDLARFTVAGTGYTGVQWQYMWPGQKVWRDVGNGTLETCTIQTQASYNGVVFRAKLYNNTSVKYTSKVKLKVVPAKLSFVTHPSSVTVNEGEVAKFTVAVRGATSIQWLYQWPNDSTWYVVENATDTTCSIRAKASYDGVLFRCKASNSTSSIYSNTARLTVKVPTKFAITSHPQSVTVYEGEKATFSVSATGATSYQWQVMLANDSTWRDLDGITSTGISVTAKLDFNGYRFRCKVSNGSSTLYSNAATLTVKKRTTEPETSTKYRALLIGVEHSLSWAKSYSDIPDKYRSSYLYVSGWSCPYFYVDVTKRNTGDTTLMSNMLNNVYGGKTAGSKYAVTTRIDPSYSEIKSLIQTTFSGTTDNDVSLFFIATHGASSADGELTMPFTQSLTESNITSHLKSSERQLPFSTLAAWLGQYVKGDVIVVIESCGAGSAIYYSDSEQNGVRTLTPADEDEIGRAFVSKAISAFSEADSKEGNSTGDLRKSRYYVLAAARHREVSYGSEYYQRNIFTKRLVDGVGSIGNMPADKAGNSNGIVDLTELFNYIKQFQDDDNQHVQRYPVNSTYPLFRGN